MIRFASSLVLFFLMIIPLKSQEVADTIEPQIRVRNAVVYLDPKGHARLSPDIFDNGSKDNSGRVTLSADRTEFGCHDVGEHRILVTASDESGNSAATMTILTVEDTIPPNIITHPRIISLDPSGMVSPDPVLFDHGSTDACGIREMSIDPSIFSCGDLGDNRVIFTVTDRNGNSAAVPVLATIVDDSPPDVHARNITIELNAEGTASVNPDDIDFGSTDPCGIKSINIDPSSFSSRNLGNNIVRLIVTDRSGNTAVAQAIVTVADILPPTAVARDQVVLLDENGFASLAVTDIDAGSSDNCGIRSMTVEPSGFDCSHTGKNKVILTVTDLSGNKATAEANVIVEDHIPPSLTVHELRLQITEEGIAIPPDDTFRNWSYDPCGLSNLSLEVSSFGCSDIGTRQVMFSATDNNGNISSGLVQVTIEDHIPPVVRTKNISLKLDAGGTAILTPEDINDGSSDNCAIKTMSLDREEFTGDQVGENEVELTVVDSSGNKTSGKALVIISKE